jgi:hypothetical protein
MILTFPFSIILVNEFITVNLQLFLIDLVEILALLLSFSDEFSDLFEILVSKDSVHLNWEVTFVSAQEFGSFDSCRYNFLHHVKWL